MNSIADLVSKVRGKKRVRKYRVVNDLTQESFVVEGPDIEGCRIIADRKCKDLQWDMKFMRSEELS